MKHWMALTRRRLSQSAETLDGRPKTTIQRDNRINRINLRQTKRVDIFLLFDNVSLRDKYHEVSDLFFLINKGSFLYIEQRQFHPSNFPKARTFR